MKNFTFQPGQVGQLSVFGVGESTFVINSSPTRMDYLQFSVMKARRNTTPSQAQYRRQDRRPRPLGNWFPYDQWKGQNGVFFIGGGIRARPHPHHHMVYLLDNPQGLRRHQPAVRRQTPPDLSLSQTCPVAGRKDLRHDHRQPCRWLGASKVGLIPNALTQVFKPKEFSIAVLRPADHDQIHPRGPRRAGLPG